MAAGINNVIYMELHSGPKMANGTCRKTIVAGMIDRGSTVYTIPQYVIYCIHKVLWSRAGFPKTFCLWISGSRLKGTHR